MVNKNILLLQKELDKIPFRVNFIKELLDGKGLNSLIQFDACETEAFFGNNSNDVRTKIEKQLLDFGEIIRQIDSKLLYVKSGTTGHTFKGIKAIGNGETINFGIKVVAYPKKSEYGSMYKIDRPENTELLMLKVLSYFVLKKNTPHIVLPIGTFNTSIKPFVSLNNKRKIIRSKKYDMFIKRFENGDYHNIVSVLMSEWANKGDLLDYIKKHVKNISFQFWKVIFFQIISVLAVIQHKYPSFRHNDLKANNVLLHKIDSKVKNTLFKYKINGKCYEVPHIGYQIKLWDFDFACIPGKVDNAKVSAKWTDKINVKPIENKYYDLHYFFNMLTRRGFCPEFFNLKEIHPEVKKFVRRVVPEKYAHSKYEMVTKYDKKEKKHYEAKVFTKDNVVAERGRILHNIEYTTPDKLLKNDPFFEEFRI
jgi:serine/threonine protein kinase